MIQTENDDVAQRPGSSVEGDAAVEQPAAVVNHHLPDSAVAGGGNNERLRRRKKLPPHRHMPPQRKAEEDTERNAVPKRLLGKSLGDIDRFRRNVSALVVLLLIGVIGVVYVRPTIFFARHQKQQRLPRRTITTVFPRHLHIGQALPPVVMGYAIASPDNERERAAVRHVAAQRLMVTAPTPGTRQVILFNPIEHGDFVHRLITSQPGALDYFCGAGYQQVYQRQEAAAAVVDHNNFDGGPALDDLLLACLLQSGTADGYVKYTVQVHASLSRRTNGVAAQYRNQPRILSDFLWLPILENVSSSNIKGKKTKTSAVPMVPSTTLPFAMTQHLLSSSVVVDPVAQLYRREWEEFLYTAIINNSERDKWTLLTAVCTDEERAELAATARLIATSCHNHSGGGGDETPGCCWVFDTTLQPN